MRQFIVRVNGEEFQVEVEEIGSGNRTAPVIPAAAPIHTPPRAVQPKKPVANIKESNIIAPMPGTILGIKVKEGDQVKAGDVIVVLEAMKLENNLTAPVSGTIKAIRTSVGASVNPGDLLAEIA